VVGTITDLGATLVAVSPQMETFNREFIQKHRLTFDILSDPGNQVANTFGLVHELPEDLCKVYRAFGIDLERFNADGLWRLPMPARYVVDRDSVVRSADVNPDYTVRPEPDETVEFLRKLINPA
jgi:peroxiredoxin